MTALTDSIIRRARPRSSKYELVCSGQRGLVLRVLPSGKKVYYARFRRDGRDVRERIGPVEEVTLEEARERTRELRGSEAPPPRRPATTSRAKPLTTSQRTPATRPTPEASVPRFREFAARYLADHVDVHLKPDTRASYRRHARSLLALFGGDALIDIDPERVERWHASMRDTPCEANNAVRVLSHMFTKAYEWRLVPRTHPKPTLYVRKFRERRRERFLTPDERRRLEQVLQEAEARTPYTPGAINWSTAMAIRLLALTGMRRSEVLSLDWSMVDFRHRCLRLPDSKTGRRVVPIGSPVLAILGELREQRTDHSPIVLLSQRGTRIQPASLTRAWGMIRKRAGLHDVRLHDLRHSAASDAIMNGVPLAVVGKILGHSQPSTTARYAHIADDVLARAVETMSVSIASCTPEAVQKRTRRRGKLE